MATGLISRPEPKLCGTTAPSSHTHHVPHSRCPLIAPSLSHRSFDSWDRGSQRVEGGCRLAMSYCLSASRNGKQTLNYSKSLNIF